MIILPQPVVKQSMPRFSTQRNTVEHDFERWVMSGQFRTRRNLTLTLYYCFDYNLKQARQKTNQSPFSRSSVSTPRWWQYGKETSDVINNPYNRWDRASYRVVSWIGSAILSGDALRRNVTSQNSYHFYEHHSLDPFHGEHNNFY